MKTNFCVFLLVSFTSLITGNLIFQPTFAQSEFSKDFDQQNKEKFLELGEEGFRKDCYKNSADFPKSVLDDVCEFMIDKMKNETGTLQQNQTLESVTGSTTYTTHNDYSNGLTVQYPTDWHVSYDGGKIFKGTREFKITAHDNPKVSVLDTNSFGDIIFEVQRDNDGIKITDKLGRLNIDGEPALSFSYSEGDKEYRDVVLMHNNIGYVFEYGTLKENFDKDFDTMMHFFGTLRLS